MSDRKKNEVAVADPHNVAETFVTSVAQVGLISGSSVAVTLGVRRLSPPDDSSEPQETLFVTSRLVLTLDAAQNLVEAVEMMLARAKTGSEPIIFNVGANKSR